MRKSKIKIVNFRKFISSISIVLILIIIGSFIIAKSSFSYTQTNYKTILVVSGDTLWAIAQKEKQYNMYYKNKDIRYIIDSLKEINNMENSNLYIGQSLTIPTE